MKLDNIKHIKLEYIRDYALKFSGPEGWSLHEIPYGFQIYTDPAKEQVFTILESPGQDGTTPLIIIYTAIDGGNKILLEDRIQGYKGYNNIASVMTDTINREIDKWNSIRQRLNKEFNKGDKRRNG